MNLIAINTSVVLARFGLVRTTRLLATSGQFSYAFIARNLGLISISKHTHSTSPMDRSPRAKLPPELRCLIYDLVLISPYAIPILACQHDAKVPSDDVRTALALLSTCKSIRREALGTFYSGNTFQLEVEGVLGDDNNDWYVQSGVVKHQAQRDTCILRGCLVSIGANAQLVRDIQMELGRWKLWHALRRSHEPRPEQVAAAIKCYLSYLETIDPKAIIVLDIDWNYECDGELFALFLPSDSMEMALAIAQVTRRMIGVQNKLMASAGSAPQGGQSALEEELAFLQKSVKRILTDLSESYRAKCQRGDRKVEWRCAWR
jgi:hypothetical protein